MVEGLNMKILFLFMSLFSLAAFAQDPLVQLSNFDQKVYSLKTKGVKDFVVDLESSKLTKQLNEQMIFGQIKELIFRVYWTANPERVAIEIIGLPEGFKEIKEELKLNITSMLENLIPLPIEKKFVGYTITKGKQSGEYFAKDQTGVAPIPGYILKFDQQNRLVEIEGKKPVGSFQITPNYTKEPFTDGKWVLKSQVTNSSESGQEFISKKDLFYTSHQGIGVLSQVKITTQQKWNAPDTKPLTIEETMNFKNYKIDSGEGLKYFLGESQN